MPLTYSKVTNISLSCLPTLFGCAQLTFPRDFPGVALENQHTTKALTRKRPWMHRPLLNRPHYPASVHTERSGAPYASPHTSVPPQRTSRRVRGERLQCPGVPQLGLVQLLRCYVHPGLAKELLERRSRNVHRAEVGAGRWPGILPANWRGAPPPLRRRGYAYSPGGSRRLT